ncbi:MAG: protein kinase [Solirubrobacterales bacterium]|jgi:serine/threonine protein kinase|nr:protein kinase [Solirubrobacterales bacterium]
MSEPTVASGWGFEEGHEIAPERTIVGHLGGGSEFDVYLVWDDLRLTVLVAKLLRPHLVDDPDALRRLRREALALERLSHPIVLRSFDAVLDGPLPHLLLEHLEGWTLRRILRRGGPLGLEQVLPLALHVASALHYLAREGWVHLDVKPDNIIMGLPPRLIDLSVARPLEEAARLRSALGTDAYMAPEQCDPQRFEAAVGTPADVWGLGATLHHAVTGEVPFERAPQDAGSSDLHVRFPQLHREPGKLPRGTPPELAQLLAATMHPDPGQRPTAAAVALALEPLVESLPRRMTLGRRGIR